jgi:integrase/recombinase XerD
MRLVTEFFGETMVLDQFTTTLLNRFMDWIERGRGVPCSRKSYARRVTTLKVFFKFLKSEHVMPDDPAAALLQRSGAAPLQPILTDAEIERLLAQTAVLRLADRPDARLTCCSASCLTRLSKKRMYAAQNGTHCARRSFKPDPDHPAQKPGNVYRAQDRADPDWLNVLDEYVEQYTPPDTIFDCTARNLEYILGTSPLLLGSRAKCHLRSYVGPAPCVPTDEVWTWKNCARKWG